MPEKSDFNLVTNHSLRSFLNERKNARNKLGILQNEHCSKEIMIIRKIKAYFFSIADVMSYNFLCDSNANNEKKYGLSVQCNN